MRIRSPEFEQGGVIPAEFTCDGANVRPPLAIENLPDGAASVAIIMDDPDAPTGTWVHWTVWNLPAAEGPVPGDILPAGAVEGRTSFGGDGYGGPCPPSGRHRYFFKAFALDVALDIPAGSDAEALMRAMEGHVLDKAGLIGTYARE